MNSRSTTRTSLVLVVALIALIVGWFTLSWATGRKVAVDVLDARMLEPGVVELGVNSCNEEPELAGIQANGDVVTVDVIAFFGNNDDCADVLTINVDAAVTTIIDSNSGAEFDLGQPLAEE